MCGGQQAEGSWEGRPEATLSALLHAGPVRCCKTWIPFPACVLCARLGRYQCSNHIKYGDNGVLRLVASEPLEKGDEVGKCQALSWKLAGTAISDTFDTCRHCVVPLLLCGRCCAHRAEQLLTLRPWPSSHPQPHHAPYLPALPVVPTRSALAMAACATTMLFSTTASSPPRRTPPGCWPLTTLSLTKRSITSMT